jgi:hypothetical protein|tara:strand:- start:393 stop:1580 length:1188 start_codon:yes stop_codon:yes gene_type:complete
MNFGYVKDTAGITKPINLDDIKIINVTSDSITIRYNLTGTSSIVDELAFFISFNNTGDISTGQIESQFYKWLKNALISTSPSKASLNSAMPQLEIVTAGLINTSGYRNATFLAAVDETAACAASPTAACVVESEVGTPPVGTLVLANPSTNDYEPIADGTYALNVGGSKYFMSLIGSRIVQITVCPLVLDFVFDPNQQASGTPSDSNYFSLANVNSSTFINYYGAFSMSAFTGSGFSISCSSLTSLKGSNDRTWPCGYIVNGFLDATKGLGQLPAFAIQLADPNVASWNGATLYVSDDYYVTGDYTQATWVGFNEDYWLQGFSNFGNGTQFPAGGISPTVESLIMGPTTDPSTLQPAGRVFIPAGTSISGNAVFGATQFVTLTRTGDLKNSSNCT